MNYSALEKPMRFPFLLCLLLGGVSACGQELASSKDFLVGVYAEYQSPDGSNPLGKAADTLFVPELLALIRLDQKRAEGGVGLLDFDPICDCQDFEISNVRIQVSQPGKHRQDAKVAFTNYGKETQLVFALAREGNHWRIADIRSASRPSLVRFLQTRLSPPVKGE